VTLPPRPTACSIASRPSATQEDVTKFLEPMAAVGEDPIGSMGTDTPIAVLSKRSRLLYDYFKQNFAQVTNPPIDPIREELVMSLVSMIGPRPNLLGHDAGSHKRLEVDQPILTNEDVAKIRSVEAARRRVPHRHDRYHLGRGHRCRRPAMAIKEMCWPRPKRCWPTRTS
jgi:glutamate synthase (NADPH/NADH) large chain